MTHTPDIHHQTCTNKLSDVVTLTKTLFPVHYAHQNTVKKKGKHTKTTGITALVLVKKRERVHHHFIPELSYGTSYVGKNNNNNSKTRTIAHTHTPANEQEQAMKQREPED